MKLTRKDSEGRIWNYCDSEGTWTLKTENARHVIGCGGNNGSKWAIWSGPMSGDWEYKTLKQAMAAC